MTYIACSAPGRNEEVGFIPAIEAQAERTVLEHAIYLSECSFKLGRAVVVAHGLSASRAVTAKVRWIGENEIN
jgi:hypothetical protein